jgi:hypothetical protein
MLLLLLLLPPPPKRPKRGPVLKHVRILPLAAS